MTPQLLEPSLLRTDVLQDFDVVFVDRRAFSLDPKLQNAQDDLRRFAEKGGHVIVLHQDTERWNADPLIPGLKLYPSQSYDESAVVEADSSHGYLMKPNVIQPNDWDDWLWFRSYASAEINSPGLEIPARVQNDGNPLIVTQSVGKGRITYVNLALQPQLLNVHPGALRLLANLLSY